MISYRDTDFDDGGFGGPSDAYNHAPPFFLNPYLIDGLVMAGVVLGIVMAIAYFMGRQKARRDMTAERQTSVDAIYDSVKYMLERSLKAPGYAVLERGRRVAEMLESRLGLVLALNDKPGKLIKELEEALKGEKERASSVPKPPKVKVPLPTDEHLARVWRALHEFNAFWTRDDGKEIKALIRDAQVELTTLPPEVVKARTADTADGWWPFKRPAKVIEAALNDADKAGSAPIIVPPPASASEAPPPDPDPTPTPPAPPPPKKDKRNLPAHKRNMLA